MKTSFLCGSSNLNRFFVLKILPTSCLGVPRPTPSCMTLIVSFSLYANSCYWLSSFMTTLEKRFITTSMPRRKRRLINCTQIPFQVFYKFGQLLPCGGYGGRYSLQFHVSYKFCYEASICYHRFNFSTLRRPSFPFSTLRRPSFPIFHLSVVNPSLIVVGLLPTPLNFHCSKLYHNNNLKIGTLTRVLYHIVANPQHMTYEASLSNLNLVNANIFTKITIFILNFICLIVLSNHKLITPFFFVVLLGQILYVFATSCIKRIKVALALSSLIHYVSFTLSLLLESLIILFALKHINKLVLLNASIYFFECISLGYSSPHKGYKCMTFNDKIFILKDIIFNKSKFSLVIAQSTPPTIVPHFRSYPLGVISTISTPYLAPLIFTILTPPPLFFILPLDMLLNFLLPLFPFLHCLPLHLVQLILILPLSLFPLHLNINIPCKLNMNMVLSNLVFILLDLFLRV
ncbi:hypothetical protein CR513_00245, partial [Mucuna pruriens]